MAEIEIGLGKSGRRAYGLDEVSIVPSRRTRDPEHVELGWEIDAFQFGLPVLASPVGGIEDYLIDGVNGFHIQRDAQNIALRLDQVLNDPTLHGRLRENGLATAQNYSWEKIAKQYLNLFNEMLAERARRVRGFALPDQNVSPSVST